MPRLAPFAVAAGSACASLFALACLSTAAQAQTPPAAAFVQQVRTGYAVQTGDGNQLTPAGYGFMTDLTVVPGHGFEIATWSLPGGETIVLPLNDVGFGFHYDSERFATRELMDARFAAGAHVYTLSGPGRSEPVTLNATTGPYPDAFPYLTGSTFSALQGMEAGNAFDFHLSPVTAPAPGSEQTIAFFVDDVLTGETRFAAGGIADPSFTVLSMPARTLEGGRRYQFQFYLGNRVDMTADNAGGASQGFTLLTTGEFTTAVPEPETVALLLAGLVLVVARQRGRQAT
ncbi:MAG: PEP-CTERM sorting domain-containing protein [Burkholderiales bacterium]